MGIGIVVLGEEGKKWEGSFVENQGGPTDHFLKNYFEDPKRRTQSESKIFLRGPQYLKVKFFNKKFLMFSPNPTQKVA